ncbi:hypothetical protein AB6A40_000804 [Gnathostoma spinigerum]|uniref:SAM domain-containing protein n=1 Tax=Gnathostoma spinigerum TaxID=75299 RepID=A0ABD6E3T6_9BILA
MGDDENEGTYQRLITACECWDLDGVQDIVSRGFIVDTFDDDHITALQVAAAVGNIGIVEYLLDSGADIEKSNQVGMTAFHHACHNGHINVVRILVQRGANYTKSTYLGATPITLASAGGHIELVKLLLDLGVSVNPTHTALCPTPIIAAAFRHQIHMCALLAHRGALIDGCVPRLSNLSALSTAISCESLSLVRALLDLGANPSFRSLDGRNAVELASFLNYNDIADLVNMSKTTAEEKSPPIIDLPELIAKRDASSVGAVLERRVPYAVLPEGTTPLMYAVLLADINIVKIVAERTNDLNAAENIAGLTPLMMAVIVGDQEVVRYLLMQGADVTTESADGMTALDYAFSGDCLENDIMCLLQRQAEYGRPPPLPKTDSHNAFRHTFGHSTSKILNKITTHVGLASGSTEQKHPIGRVFFDGLLNGKGGELLPPFVIANDILRSVGSEPKAEPTAGIHRCIELARCVAELRKSNGIAPAPVGFPLVNDSVRGSVDPYESSADSRLSSKSQWSDQKKEYLSLAQRNADLYYEQQPHRLGERQMMSGHRLFFDDDSTRKHSSSASASESEKSSQRMRKLSSLDRGSTNTLGTTARLRVPSREVITADDGEDDERSSPSRLSLNQYTFALRDEDRALRKSTSMPCTPVLLCRSVSNACIGEKPGVLRATGVDVERRKHQNTEEKSQKLTEDMIWRALRESDLGEYVELLRSEEIDRATFLILTDADLSSLGIKEESHRARILKIARLFRKMFRKVQ